MTTLAHTVSDSRVTVRRNVRRLIKFPVLTVMLVSIPVVFLLLFVFTGIGNGSIYRMIPAVFDATATDTTDDGRRRTRRVAAGAIGIVGAVGAFGGFVVPQMFALSKASSISAICRALSAAPLRMLSPHTMKSSVCGLLST